VNRLTELQAWFEPRADEMAALVEELVAVDTENPPGRGLGRCGALLRHAMARLGLSPELIQLEPSNGLEDPCIVRGSVGEACARSTFTVISTSCQHKTPRSSNRNGATGGSSGAGRPT
jgi:acetylornithine deacetylase/succinyl-diaminopimelate desuccinylase-like protein